MRSLPLAERRKSRASCFTASFAPFAERASPATSAGARRPIRGRSNDVDADVDQGDSAQHAKDAPDAQEWSWH